MENTGGPKVYFGRPMDNAHAHLSLTANEFNVILHECKETFNMLGVPEKEPGELMAGLEAQRAKAVTAEAEFGWTALTDPAWHTDSNPLACSMAASGRPPSETCHTPVWVD